jgi:adenylate kinase family enzyme
MRRVSVVGTSGSGKSTLAAALARRLGAPHVELDAIYHQPAWEPLPKEEFRTRVAALTADETWVVDGNYASVLGLVWQRADTVVWLDLPRHVIMRRLVWRTLRRFVLRTELWNGNREPWINFFSTDPEKSVIAYAWKHHPRNQERFSGARADPRNAHLTFVRLRTGREAAEFLRQLA